MNAGHGGGHSKGFPALSYPELFRVTPLRLLSLVLAHPGRADLMSGSIEDFTPRDSETRVVKFGHV